MSAHSPGGPGLVRSTRSSISGTSAGPSRTASASGAVASPSSTSWTPSTLKVTSHCAAPLVSWRRVCRSGWGTSGSSEPDDDWTGRTNDDEDPAT